MSFFVPLLFLILLSVALEARDRRSVGGPRWRPGEDLRCDRDEARRIADLVGQTDSSSSVHRQGAAASAAALTGPENRRTAPRPMPTVVS
jgi:hypothetical protein